MDIKLVNSNDWEGIYINNKLEFENHKMSCSDVLNIVVSYINDHKDFKDIIFEEYKIDSKWLDNHGDLPINFNSIPEDVLF